MTDRIRPPKDLEPLLDQLKDLGLFSTKQKGMMFAAALGAELRKQGKDLEEVERKGEGIRLEYFESVRDDGFLDALAISHAGNLGILDESRMTERVELFEQYALLGLRELDRLIGDRARDPLDVVLDLFDRLKRGRISTQLPGLDEDISEIEALLE